MLLIFFVTGAIAALTVFGTIANIPITLRATDLRLEVPLATARDEQARIMSAPDPWAEYTASGPVFSSVCCTAVSTK